jgi:hypothetical protein
MDMFIRGLFIFVRAWVFVCRNRRDEMGRKGACGTGWGWVRGEVLEGMSGFADLFCFVLFHLYFCPNT